MLLIRALVTDVEIQGFFTGQQTLVVSVTRSRASLYPGFGTSFDLMERRFTPSKTFAFIFVMGTSHYSFQGRGHRFVTRTKFAGRAFDRYRNVAERRQFKSRSRKRGIPCGMSMRAILPGCGIAKCFKMWPARKSGVSAVDNASSPNCLRR